MEAKLAEIEVEFAKAIAGGGPKYVERQHKRGKLTLRERLELLLDEDTPFLELLPLDRLGQRLSGRWNDHCGYRHCRRCRVYGRRPDSTVKGGAMNGWSLKKQLRVNEILAENPMPVISLTESGGADLPSQKDVFVPGGAMFRDLTQASADKIPTISLVFGNSTAGGAYIPGMSDYVVMVKGGAKVFLAGPPLVKMATGEETDDEALGGAEMHAKISGLADYLAQDEQDAIRIGRNIVKRLNWRKKGPEPSRDYLDPLYSQDELIGIVPGDLKIPFDPREVIARVVDGSDFDEFKPLYGSALATGFAEIHGYKVGIIANARGVLMSEESQKATQFIQLCNAIDTPLVYLHNTTGYMVGKEFEQKGIIKHGAQMINAVSNSKVPAISVLMGASYGAGHYGMCGRAFEPRFVFAWPSSKCAVMGSAQLAGVVKIVARQAHEGRGNVWDDAAEAFASAIAGTEKTIDRESTPLFMSGLVMDDGIIDPRDTRTVLGMALSAIHVNPVEGTDRFGVFRM